MSNPPPPISTIFISTTSTTSRKSSSKIAAPAKAKSRAPKLIVDEHVGKFLTWQASVELIGVVDALRHKLKDERAAIRSRAC